MKDKQIGLIAMVIASLGLAVAVMLMKVIPQVTHMPPQHVAIWRFALAVPPLWAYLSLQHHSRQAKFRHPWPFLGLGLIYSIASFSAIFALQRLSSSIYVILIYIYPSLVVLYALLSGRSTPRLLWFGLPLTLTGLFLTTFEFGIALTIDPIGMVITMMNALALAAYMLLSEKVFKAHDEPIIGTMGVLSGGMLAGLLLIPFLGISTPSSFEGWVLLVSFGIFGTLMPIVAMNISLKKLGAARGSLIITLQPVLTVLMALIFLKETLTLQQWVGGGLVILSIILLQRSPDRVAKPAKQGVEMTCQ
jgi:drug/metabolite transporter (DMT)-like permease